MLYRQFPHLEAHSPLVHFQTTRKGGVSNAPFDSLNLSDYVGDLPENVAQNRSILATTLGIPTKNWITAEQVHSNIVSLVTAHQESPVPKTDALITATQGLCLMIQTADCVPVLLYDTKNRAIAAIHAGWRGTVANIVGNTITKMQGNFGTNPADLVVGIGAAISVDAYQVGEEVEAAVQQLFGTTAPFMVYRNGERYFDLHTTIEWQLLDLGVLPTNIDNPKWCTVSENDSFFSYRKESGKTGRLMAGIMLQ